MLKRKLGIVFGIMLIFSLISYFFIKAYGRDVLERDGETKIIVTSFYPVYIITENLTKGMDGIQVVNLTENQTGCLHDYQLTTKDMLVLEKADILVVNGGDMELFLMGAIAGLPDLPVVDSCTGLDFLMGEGHHHGEEEAIHGGEEEELSVNGHVWMDMDRYRMQIQSVSEALCQIDPEHASLYRQNEEEYLEKIEALQKEYEAALSGLEGLEVIIFHDAFFYLCDELGLEVIHGIDMDADSALNAGEIAEIADEIQLHGVRYLLAEGSAGSMEATGEFTLQGADVAQKLVEQVAKENGCQVVYLTPLTSGDMDADAYLKGMRENMEVLKGIGNP